MSLRATMLMIVCGALFAATPAGAVAATRHDRSRPHSHHSHHVHHRSHTRHHSSGIPQHNGGDRDGDNNGGASDGDGNI